MEDRNGAGGGPSVSLPPWRRHQILIPAAVTTVLAAPEHVLCFLSYLPGSCAEGAMLPVTLPPPTKVTQRWCIWEPRGGLAQSVAHPPDSTTPLVGFAGSSLGHRACGAPGPW